MGVLGRSNQIVARRERKGPTVDTDAVDDEDAKPQHVQSYEDIEGLVVNAGVLSALILGFAVGILASGTREDLAAAEQLDLAYRYEAFRDFIDPDGTRRAALGIPDNITAAFSGDAAVMDGLWALCDIELPDCTYKGALSPAAGTQVVAANPSF